MVVRGANYPRKKDEFYATPPETTRVLLDMIKFSKRVCDPACGDGAIQAVLKEYGYTVSGKDLLQGYNFLTDRFLWPGRDIVTNPPFGIGGRTAAEFVAHALEITKPWRGKVAMLLPVDFDSGKTRLRLFEHSAFARKIILVNRIRWFNGKSGSINHCWCVWDHRHVGLPRLRYGLQKYPEPKEVDHA